MWDSVEFALVVVRNPVADTVSRTVVSGVIGVGVVFCGLLLLIGICLKGRKMNSREQKFQISKTEGFTSCDQVIELPKRDSSESVEEMYDVVGVTTLETNGRAEDLSDTDKDSVVGHIHITQRDGNMTEVIDHGEERISIIGHYQDTAHHKNKQQEISLR